MTTGVVPQLLFKARPRVLDHTNLNWMFNPTKLVIPETTTVKLTKKKPICCSRNMTSSEDSPHDKKSMKAQLLWRSGRDWAWALAQTGTIKGSLMPQSGPFPPPRTSKEDLWKEAEGASSQAILRVLPGECVFCWCRRQIEPPQSALKDATWTHRIKCNI